MLDERDNIGVLSNKLDATIGARNGARAWSGYVNDPEQRLKSSSGGLVTAVLEHLFKTGRIQCAVVAYPLDRRSNSSDQRSAWFSARAVHSIERAKKGCGTKYYPVDLSGALREVVDRKEKAALVALPCQVTGLRLASISRRFRESFPYVLGLVCGCQVSTHFTDYLIAHTGAQPNRIKQVDYRDKKGAARCFDHRFTVSDGGEVCGKRLAYSKSAFAKAWDSHMFALRGCDFCPDVFATEADASFMDAWLPEHLEDSKGNSLVLARAPRMIALMEELIDSGAVVMQPIGAGDVARSQRGAIHYKRKLLPDRLQYAVDKGQSIPPRLKSLASRGNWRQRRINARWRRNRWIAHKLWTSTLPLTVRAAAVHLLTSRGSAHLISSVKRLIIRFLGRDRARRIRRYLVSGS